MKLDNMEDIDRIMYDPSKPHGEKLRYVRQRIGQRKIFAREYCKLASSFSYRLLEEKFNAKHFDEARDYLVEANERRRDLGRALSWRWAGSLSTVIAYLYIVDPRKTNAAMEGQILEMVDQNKDGIMHWPNLAVNLVRGLVMHMAFAKDIDAAGERFEKECWWLQHSMPRFKFSAWHEPYEWICLAEAHHYALALALAWGLKVEVNPRYVPHRIRHKNAFDKSCRILQEQLKWMPCAWV